MNSINNIHHIHCGTNKYILIMYYSLMSSIFFCISYARAYNLRLSSGVTLHLWGDLHTSNLLFRYQLKHSNKGSAKQYQLERGGGVADQFLYKNFRNLQWEIFCSKFAGKNIYHTIFEHSNNYSLHTLPY